MERVDQIFVSDNQPDRKSSKFYILDPYSRKMAMYAYKTGLFDSNDNSFTDEEFCISVNAAARAMVFRVKNEPKIPKDFVTVVLIDLSELNKIAVMRGKEIFQFIDVDKKTADNYAPITSFSIDTGNKIMYKNEGMVDLTPDSF